MPLRGLSTLGAPGGPYHDPAVDGALFTALRAGLEGSAVRVVDHDTHINTEEFGRSTADRLHRLIPRRAARGGTGRADGGARRAPGAPGAGA
ncbi:Tm-1-like ATP-binding domain-containing protein [Streptomyces zhihengii]